MKKELRKMETTKPLTMTKQLLKKIGTILTMESFFYGLTMKKKKKTSIMEITQLQVKNLLLNVIN